MSTTVEQTRQEHGRQYAEFDEYIDFQVQRLRAGIRTNDVFTALCGIAVIVTAYLLAFVILDHWVIDGGFSHSTRLMSMLLLIVGTAAWIGLRVVRPCLRRVNRLYAARLAEASSKELDSNLLNYEDLRRAGRSVPKPILKALEKRAAVALSKTDVDEAVDRRLLLRLSVSLLTVVLLFCLYTVLTPKKVWPSIWRAVNPVTATQVATQTEIVDVQPGNKPDVLARTLLEVTVDLRGEVPENVELVYSTLDRSRVDERVALRRSDETLKRFACVLKGPDGDGLLQGLTYHIEAGDAVSPTYRIDVIQPPAVTVDQIHYAYPDYMELRPERRESPVVDVWEGTRLTFSASTNMPVQRAWIEFSDTESFPLNPEPLPMDIEDGTRLSVEWQAMIRDQVQTPQFYRIRCRTEAGATDPAPAVYPLAIRPDEGPQIEAVYPTADIERPANAIVPLLLRAADPDFRLTRVTLRSRHGAIDLSDRVLWRGNERTAEVEHDLKLEELGLKPGDVLTWWGEARDNRVIDSPTRRLKDNNVSITPQLRIRISEPVSESEVAEQQAFDVEQRQEQIDKLNQEPRGSNESDSVEESGERGPDEVAEPDRANSEGQVADPASDVDRKSDKNAEGAQGNDGESQTGAGAGKAGDQSGQGVGEGSQSESPSEDGTSSERSNERDAESSGKSSRDGDSPSPEQTNDEKPAGDDRQGQGPGNRRSVSNDGSDDDQVLRELLRKQQQENQADGTASEAQADEQPGNDKQPGKDGDSKSGDGGSSSEASPDNESEMPGQNGDGNSGQSGDSASSKTDSDSQSANGKGENEKPGADPDANRNRDSATDSSPNNDGTPSSPSGSESPSNKGDNGSARDSGSSAKGGSESGTPDGQPQENGDSSGADSQGKSPNTDESEKRGNSGSGSDTDSRSDQNSQPGSSGSEGSSGDSASGSAGKPSGDQGGSKSDGGKQSSKSGGASGAKSGQGGNTSESGSASSGDGKSGAQSGSSSDADAGKSASSDSPNGRENSGNAQQSSDGGELGQTPREDGASSKGAGGSQGGDSSPSESESGGKSGAANEQPGADAKGGEQQSSGAGEQKSGGESASGQSGGQAQSGDSQGGQSGQSGADGGSSGGSESGSPSGSGQGSGSKGGSPKQVKSGQGRPEAGGEPDAPSQTGAGEGGGEGSAEAEPVNVEDRLKATNLILKQLQEDLDRGQVDQQLLDKLGWTEDDMRRFTERLKQRLSTDDKPADPGEAARARQFREMLKSLDLKASSRERLDAFERKETTTDFSDLRERVPQKYRGAFEKYLDKLARQKRTANQ